MGADSLLTLNGSLTATSYYEDASHIQGPEMRLVLRTVPKHPGPLYVLNEGRDTLRRRRLAAFLFVALVSVLGATACVGPDQQRIEDLEDRVEILEEQVEALTEEELEEALQQGQTQERTQEQTQERTQ